jgi:hypothetical protein
VPRRIPREYRQGVEDEQAIVTNPAAKTPISGLARHAGATPTIIALLIGRKNEGLCRIDGNSYRAAGFQ